MINFTPEKLNKILNKGENPLMKSKAGCIFLHKQDVIDVGNSNFEHMI